MMGSRRPEGAHAAGRAGGVPSHRYQMSPAQNARFSADPAAPQPERARRQAPPPGYPAATARTIANRTHRHRYAARPWLVIVAVLAVALAGHQVPAVRALWWAWLLAGTGYAAIQGKKRARGPVPHLAYALSCTVTASAWLAITVGSGLTHGLGRIGVLTIAVPGFWPLSWWWWQYHRVRPVRRDPRPLPAPDPVIAAWDEHAGCPGGVFPGTRLVPGSAGTGARCYLIIGVRGKHTTKQLTSPDARDKIAGALATDPEHVHLERPLAGPDRNGINARLLLVDEQNAQLQQEIAWTGPSLDRAAGTWTPGVYPDTPARCALYQARNGSPHRAVNVAIAGLMSRGKSRLIDLSIAEMLWSGLYVVWYGDGQEGASAPGLRDHVDWYATRREEIVLMLKCAYKIAKARQRYDGTVRWTDSHGYARTGRGFWPATPQEPFLQIVLDECQELLTDIRVARLVRALQRLGPKLGIGVTLSTQEWLMWETGGASGDPGAQSIRSFAQSGYVALFKSGSDINANALGGSLAQVNPRTLPDESGWCYLLGPGTRPVPVRLSHIDPDELYHWLARAAGVKATLDLLSATAAGDDYAKRWDRLDALAAEPLDEAIADLDHEVAQLLGEALPDAPIAAAGDLTIKQAVLQVVRERGPIERGDIPAALAAIGKQGTKSTIDQALASWVRTSHLIKTSRGMYDVPDREDRAAGDDERGAAVLELSARRDGT